MSSLACLRVLVPEGIDRRDNLPALVNKFAGAFLEARWSFPRRHEVAGPCTFLLIEPRGRNLDHRELREMATDLQLRLFGTGGEGEVALVAFEGAASDVARFAALQTHELDKILKGEIHTPPFAGRLARITATEVANVPLPTPAPTPTPTPISNETAPLPVRDTPTPQTALRPIFHGIYFTPREIFRGSAIGLRGAPYSPLEGQRPTSGPAAEGFDRQIVAAAAQVLDSFSAKSGLLFIPISYDALVHRTTRDNYAAFLARLPGARRPQLAATVYDVPRELSYTAMPQLQAFLRRYFDYIDLQITDPAFAVEKLAPGTVNSITLVPPKADSTTRVAAIRRFSAQRDPFKTRRIWLAVSNVRTPVELKTCLDHGVPFVSGRAVTEALDRPAELHGTAAETLPLRVPHFID